jgi:hypothetical protein
MLEEGRFATLAELAICRTDQPSYVRRVVLLMLLAPDIVEQILQSAADCWACVALGPEGP